MMKCVVFYLLALLHRSVALEYPMIYIQVPTKVAANTPIEAQLDAEVHNGDTQWSSTFRVYLATSAKDETTPNFFHSDCYLIHEHTLCDESVVIADDYVLFKNTSFSVTIPANIGPSGNHYVLVAQILQTDGSYYGASLESNVFSLSGGTGYWGHYQLQGYTLWGDDGTPCTGYACVRNCSDTAYESSKAGQGNGTIQYQDCANSCPNVTINFESSTRGGQPTAELTKPTSCSTQPLVSSTARTTSSGPLSTPTRARSAAAAVGTNASSVMDRRSPCYVGFVSLVGYILIG
ncbi:uncharacterized protein BDR25DRAFT_43630 [Lindgomyces ingoldianus]|uniref:Uncharacterized protein n=1 Tax=Lindgomyces ingoldianus TaxID=673940 RepID=A0ACB6RDH2_9PLEO|nr:uncharacterized protein BDR25DRAFT_43630 [Lindgomyces ingoldianus]KAF2477090.1 hypothetical protein BDR25DRAFT_43630 [Lindgomyces ingoldianus]